MTRAEYIKQLEARDTRRASATDDYDALTSVENLLSNFIAGIEMAKATLNNSDARAELEDMIGGLQDVKADYLDTAFSHIADDSREAERHLLEAAS